jgi:hypothetical protein
MGGLCTMHDIYSTLEDEKTTLPRNIGAPIPPVKQDNIPEGRPENVGQT